MNSEILKKNKEAMIENWKRDMAARGDCSIETAKKNGGITQVHHIDWHVDNLLGIWAKYTVVVYGD